MGGLESDPARLLKQVESWTIALQSRGLVSSAAVAQLEDVLTRSRGERLDTPDDPLLVTMLCGPTAVGKSSLINAIAGSEVSTPGLGATTSSALVYVHERDDPARLFEYSEALGHLGREATSLVRHRRDELLHKVLVDTPDIDSVRQRHRELTSALVHCADIVFFVTSPQKYKNMDSARWVAEHRQQRAMAFVLNKWDRPAIGLQYEERADVDRDFRSVLANEGFRDPIVFKVSALNTLGGDAENELPALQAWLGAALDRTVAMAIQERRRRAAWGRLSAAIHPVATDLVADHPFAAKAETRIAEARAQAHPMAKSESLALTPSGLDRGLWPITPGLLGGWMSLTGRIGAVASSLRKLLSWRPTLGHWQATTTGEASAMAASEFGRPVVTLLDQTVTELTRDAESVRFALGPAAKTWAVEAQRFREECLRLPTAVEAELIAEALRPSFRRSAGLVALIAVEILITLVIILALWRIGSGFVLGNYVPGELILDASALIVSLIFLGQLAANLFFPPFHQSLRSRALHGAETLIDLTWGRIRTALSEQIKAIVELKQKSYDILASIDGFVRSVANSIDTETSEVRRLFGEGASTVTGLDPVVAGQGPVRVTAEDSSATVKTQRRPPKFE